MTLSWWRGERRRFPVMRKAAGICNGRTGGESVIAIGMTEEPGPARPRNFRSSLLCSFGVCSLLSFLGVLVSVNAEGRIFPEWSNLVFLIVGGMGALVFSALLTFLGAGFGLVLGNGGSRLVWISFLAACLVPVVVAGGWWFSMRGEWGIGELEVDLVRRCLALALGTLVAAGVVLLILAGIGWWGEDRD